MLTDKEVKKKLEKSMIEATGDYRDEVKRFNYLVNKIKETEDRKDEYDFQKHVNYIKKWKDEFFFPNVRPANPVEYGKWAFGYVRRGYANFNFVNSDASMKYFYVAINDIKLIPLYGTLSVDIIVPRGINCELIDDNEGHNDVYCMDDFTTTVNSVNIYRNIFEMIMNDKIDSDDLRIRLNTTSILPKKTNKDGEENPQKTVFNRITSLFR